MSGDAHDQWPSSAADLARLQDELGRERPAAWRLPAAVEPVVAGCFVCFPVGLSGAGTAADRAWAGAARAGYMPGLLALRAGELLDAAIRALSARPDALLVNATGWDHPQRAGLALHLGAALDLPAAGVTHRPLLAEGEWPAEERGSRSPLRLGGEIVGYWVRTRSGARPLAAHAAWRTDPETAAALVLRLSGRARTPAPLREARRVARAARSRDRQRDLLLLAVGRRGERRAALARLPLADRAARRGQPRAAHAAV